MTLNLKYIALFMLFAFVICTSVAQTKEKFNLNKGIEAYKNGDYGTAQGKFEKAYKENSTYNGALYNAANSAYRNGDFEKATEYYEQYAETLESKNDKAKAYHNLGNVFLKQEKLKESIDAYKNALRNNPNDEDTRYNLSYALSKLKQQQQRQDQENKDKNEDEKKENEDKKDGEKEDKKEGEGDKEDEKKNDEEKNSDKPKPGDKGDKEKEVEGKMSKGQIKKDLDAVNEDEKNILLKIAKQKGKKTEDNNTKDW